MTWLTLALCVGSVLRIYRIWDTDAIGQPLRVGADWLVGALPAWPARWFVMLMDCVFCLGYWISFWVVLTALLWGDQAWWLLLSASLSVSYLLGHVYPRLEDEREQ